MKRLTMRLDTKSIKNAIKELEEYKMSLRTKNELFVSRLIDEGIRIAERNVGYGKYISVTKEMENAYKLDVPLKVSLGTGKNWYEAK